MNENENISKLKAWLETDEGQACMKAVREKVEKMRQDLEKKCQVSDELLRLRVTI